MRDMVNNKQMVHLGSLTLSGTTPAASDWVDVRDFDAATLVVASRTVTDAGTAAGFTLTAQEAADTAAASATDVAVADCVGAATVTNTDDAADNALLGAVGYLGNKRYVRLNGVGTTGTNAVVDVYAVMNKPHRAPTTFVGTSVAAT